MRKSTREKLLEAKLSKAKALELNDIDDLLRLLVAGHKPAETQQVNPTQRRVAYSSEEFVGYMGAMGDAKTSTICAGLWLRMLRYPGSKWFAARHDYNDLTGTTGLRLEEMLNRLPPGTLLDRDKSPPAKWYIRPLTMDGKDDPVTLTFMGLKDGWKSYEFDGGIIDEADECEEENVFLADARCRLDTAPMWVALAFNPPQKEHWLYPACTGLDAKDRKVADPWVKLYRAEPKENERNLKAGYYDRLAKKFPEDMLIRYVGGEWGGVFPGTPVYRAEFHRKLHVRNLLWDPSAPIYRWWDFGYRHPACAWVQQDLLGRLLVLRAVVGEDMEIRPWARFVKQMGSRWFPGAKEFIDFGDPAVNQRKDTGSSLHQLTEEGIQMLFMTGIQIEPGLRAVRTLLSTLIDGEPALQFDRLGASTAIDGFRGGYRLDDRGLKPVKDGFYEHIMDAIRYGVVNMTLGGTLKPGTKAPQGSFGMIEQPDNVEYDPNQDHF